MAEETLDQILAALRALQGSHDLLQREHSMLQKRQAGLEEEQRKLEQRQLQLEMRHECLLGKVADHDVQLRSLKLTPDRKSSVGLSKSTGKVG